MLAWEYREARHRWHGRGGVLTPHRMKLSRHPPHTSVARSPVCSCGRRLPQCCRWRWHRSHE
eukprot:3216478-Prymnesium_polylepis.1